MKLFREMIIQLPNELTNKHWEIISMSLANWLLSVSKSLEYALSNINLPVCKKKRRI